MNIVVLDGYTLNPGDLSWDEFESLGDCEFFERTLPEQLLRHSANADILLTNKTVITREHIRQLPKLKYIGVLATGTNVVDLGAARERGVPVTNVPAYATASVAQYTFALLLELTSLVGLHSQSVRDGGWTRSQDFSYWERPLLELAGLTLGLVGFGNIARSVARMAVAFDMKVVAFARRQPLVAPVGIRFADLETVFRDSDVLSLHCPLTTETQHLINEERLSWLKPSALLINTARGPLVDESALAGALNEDRLAGAGLDVLSIEPPTADNPLFTAKNCIITPHIGWATSASRQRLMKVAAENVRAFLKGTPQNVVN